MFFNITGVIILYPFYELATIFHLLYLLRLFSSTTTKTKASLFILLTVFLIKQEILSLMKHRLSSLHGSCLQKRSEKAISNSRSSRVGIPVLSSRRVVVWHFPFMFVICFECLWGVWLWVLWRVIKSFFFFNIWVFSCAATLVKKTILFTVSLCSCQRLLDYLSMVLSLFYLVIYKHHILVITVLFGVLKSCVSSHPALFIFFSCILDIQDHLWLYMNFRVSLLISTKDGWNFG